MDHSTVRLYESMKALGLGHRKHSNMVAVTVSPVWLRKSTQSYLVNFVPTLDQVDSLGSIS